MATQAQVETLFQTQLNNDSRAQALAAGPNWPSFPLSFFYSSEVSVDIAVKATMLRILALDHARLPNDLWANLSSGINRATLAKDAVAALTQVSSASQPHPNNPEDFVSLENKK